ncbi:MAG TPA: archease [Candidatus Binataceae bacterium]|nr:archease [Candidatus Binataceae bacterium]
MNCVPDNGHSDDGELFREFDHTGDLGIELEAPSRPELFAHALTALSRLMVEPDGIRPLEARRLELAAASDPDLMHDLLSAALTLFLADGFIWQDASVAEQDGGLAATLRGEPFDRRRHSLIQELKAVTYHRLSVEQSNGRWRARIVIDV